METVERTEMGKKQQHNSKEKTESNLGVRQNKGDSVGRLKKPARE